MPTPDPTPTACIEPKQERSRETLERICAATTRLLETKNWPQVTVAEIVLAAGSSVGSFYARFAEKEALLDFLDERYTESVLELTRQIAERVEREEPDLETYVATLVAELVGFHRRSGGLIRALVLRARMYREPAYDERTRRMNEGVTAIFGPLLERVPSRDQATAERCFFAFSFMFSALRDRVLFPESVVAPTELDDERLAEELTTATLAYLAAAPPKESR